MYSNYYGFSHKPFELSPDPDVIFLSETHQEALSVLKYGVLNRKGFLQLTGDIGTGKSTLVQSLIRSLEENIHLCYIPNPNFTVQEFYYYLSAKFGLDEFDGNKARFILNLAAFLKQCREMHELALLIIDEAHVLSLELLEEIRLLSNQEYSEFGVLSIFFVGQQEFIPLLEHPKLLPLRNRIGISFHIEPLTLDETTAYILYRLRKAGRSTVLFSKNAFKEIHLATGGIPRTINILCDNALLEGFAEQRGLIDEVIINDCARELRKAEKDLPGPEESLEGTEENDPDQGYIPTEAPKKSILLQPGKLVLTAVALLIFFSAMAATSERWGRFPGTMPVKAWFEKLPYSGNILVPLNELYKTLKIRIVSSSSEKSAIPEKAAIATQQPDENKIQAKSISGLPQAKSEPVKIVRINEATKQQAAVKKKSIGDVEQAKSSDLYVVFSRQAGKKSEEAGVQDWKAAMETPGEGQGYFANNSVSITTDVAWANIRSGPSTDNRVLRTVAAGFPMLVIDRQEEWTLVEDYMARKGWVANSLLVANNSVILKTENDRLRSGPSMTENIVAKVNHGDVMQLIKVQGKWLKVYNDSGIIGWLEKKSVWP